MFKFLSAHSAIKYTEFLILICKTIASDFQTTDEKSARVSVLHSFARSAKQKRHKLEAREKHS